MRTLFYPIPQAAKVQLDQQRAAAAAGATACAAVAVDRVAAEAAAAEAAVTARKTAAARRAEDQAVLAGVEEQLAAKDVARARAKVKKEVERREEEGCLERRPSSRTLSLSLRPSLHFHTQQIVEAERRAVEAVIARVAAEDAAALAAGAKAATEAKAAAEQAAAVSRTLRAADATRAAVEAASAASFMKFKEERAAATAAKAAAERAKREG